MNWINNFQLFILLLISSLSYGQGMTIYGGLSSGKNGLTEITPQDHAHTGYLLGADGRLGDDDFYFLIGAQYHKLGFTATDNFMVKSENQSFNFLKGRVGFAFKPFKISEQIVPRLKLVGVVDYLLNSSKLATTQLPELQFNEAVAGLAGGLELDIYFVTLSFEYEKGFFNTVYKTDASKFDFWNMTAGINF